MSAFIGHVSIPIFLDFIALCYLAIVFRNIETVSI